MALRNALESSSAVSAGHWREAQVVRKTVEVIHFSWYSVCLVYKFQKFEPFSKDLSWVLTRWSSFAEIVKIWLRWEGIWRHSRKVIQKSLLDPIIDRIWSADPERLVWTDVVLFAGKELVGHSPAVDSGRLQTMNLSMILASLPRNLQPSTGYKVQGTWLCLQPGYCSIFLQRMRLFLSWYWFRVAPVKNNVLIIFAMSREENPASLSRYRLLLLCIIPKPPYWQLLSRHPGRHPPPVHVELRGTGHVST